MPRYDFQGESLPPAGVPAEQTPSLAEHDQGASGASVSGRLAEWVERTLASALGVERLERDPAGDFPFRLGSSLSFVRVIEAEPPRVEIAAPIVRDLERTPALLEGLNEINLKLRFVKAVVTPANEVILAADLLAWTLHERELLFVLNLVLRAADEFDSKIRERFGGLTMYEEEGEAIDV